jgi:uncharacterized repeat protein (TIGR03803 family)
MFRSLLSRFTKYRPAGRQRRMPRGNRRLVLEQLETRLTPSVVTLASFNGTNGNGPECDLLMDGSGNLYGTAYSGGAQNDGVVFKLAQGSGTITTLASFNGTNGGLPRAGLLMDGSGNLYGTAYGGGPSGNYGTVFELAQGSGTITDLALFNGTNGKWPWCTLLMDGSGNLYGTASQGGGGPGDVFEIAQRSGTITDLAAFNGNNGSTPQAGLIMDSSGNLYGTAYIGSADGTVFELMHGSGTISALATFNGTNGDAPHCPLIMDASGNLYGTTHGGGASGNGTVFELVHGSSSTITTLASFNGSNGSGPYGGLLMDASGNLYGTTRTGGVYGSGTVFALAPGSGTITTLASFNGNNGSSPWAGLVMDSGGNLYGTTAGGGAYGDGTVFEVVRGVSYQISAVPSTTAGVQQQFTVTVLNPDLTVNTGYTGTIHFTSTDPQAGLPADYTFQGSDQGVHTFAGTLYTAGSQSITGTDTSNNSISGVQGITVTAAAVTHLVISGPSSVRSNTAFSVTVTAADAYGNTVTGYTGTVHFSDSLSGATLPANYTFTTGDAGVHTFTGLKLKTRGLQTLTVTDTLNSSITGSLNITVT